MSRGRFLLLLVCVALAVRVALVLILRDPMRGPDGESSADDVEFELLARHLAAGEGYTNSSGRPTSFRAPGWPIFLAGVHLAFGVHPPLVYLVNCMLGALACVLTYGLARELFEEGGARRAGWLAAFFLPHAWFATMYYSENLFAPLLAGSLWLVMRSHGLAAGLLLGSAILTRPFAVLLVPLWGAGLLRRPASVVLFLVGTVALVLPWTLRNHAVHGRWVLVATNGGSTFYGGNNDRVVREWRLWGSWVSTLELPGRAGIEAQPDEWSHDREEWRLGQQWLREHPGEAAILMPLKLLRLVFWLPDFDGGRVNLAVRALCWVPYLALLFAAAWRVPWGDPAWWPVHSVMLATVATALVFWGSPRFRDANLPALMLYASAGWRRSEKRP